MSERMNQVSGSPTPSELFFQLSSEMHYLKYPRRELDWNLPEVSPTTPDIDLLNEAVGTVDPRFVVAGKAAETALQGYEVETDGLFNYGPTSDGERVFIRPSEYNDGFIKVVTGGKRETVPVTDGSDVICTEYQTSYRPPKIETIGRISALVLSFPTDLNRRFVPMIEYALTRKSSSPEAMASLAMYVRTRELRAAGYDRSCALLEKINSEQESNLLKAIKIIKDRNESGS